MSFWLMLCDFFGGRKLAEFHGQIFSRGKQDTYLTVLNMIFLLNAFFPFVAVFKLFFSKVFLVFGEPFWTCLECLTWPGCQCKEH